MSKPIKNLTTAAYRKRFAALEGAVLVDVRGVKSNQANNLRGALKKKSVRITVVKNSLARKALAGSKLEGLTKLLEGPSALVYGADSVVAVARELIDAAKEIPALQFKGAIMDGIIFGPDQIKELAKYPTKPEAQGRLVTLIFSPGRKLAGQVVGPGRKLASLVKAIQEKREKEAPATLPPTPPATPPAAPPPTPAGTAAPAAA